ncbi:MAG: response regulator [Cohaesibacter sp.]|nr:response regulator [Cohaesibacter sp.]
MEHHSAYGRNFDSLDIVIVDDSKTVLTMIRSMISSLKVARVRSFDRGDLALQAMLHEPPNVILTDLAMSPMSGLQLLHLIRQKTMVPLCYVPVVVITAHATQKRVSQLFEAGAHHVLAKPFSAAALQGRLKSLLTDDRLMELEGNRYIISGMRETLTEKRSKLQTLEKAREFHEHVLPQAAEKQRRVDQILDDVQAEGGVVQHVCPPRVVAAKEKKAETQPARAVRSSRYARVAGRRKSG